MPGRTADALAWRSQQQARLVDLALARAPVYVRATTFRKAWSSASRPVLVLCDDGEEYVVKGSQAGRMIFNDHVAATLGAAIGAAVGLPRLVDLPAALIGLQPEMAHLTPGLAHGTRWIPGSTERESIQYTGVPENRSRFAALAVLYGWLGAGDHQFIYEAAAPNRVTSVDHGHFFPGGPDWTAASLATAPPPTLDSVIETACHLTPEEVEGPKLALSAVSDAYIAVAVGRPPSAWNASRSERLALAAYLATRRDLLVQAVSTP